MPGLCSRAKPWTGPYRVARRSDLAATSEDAPDPQHRITHSPPALLSPQEGGGEFKVATGTSLLCKSIGAPRLFWRPMPMEGCLPSSFTGAGIFLTQSAPNSRPMGLSSPPS